MAIRNVNHKEAEKNLQDNGGIPPKKPLQKSFAHSTEVDMSMLIKKAVDFKKIMREQKEKRRKEKKRFD